MIHTGGNRGALIIVERNDGALIVAEMPKPHLVTFEVEDASPPQWIQFDVPPRSEYYLSVAVRHSFMGRYSFISRDHVDDWLRARTQPGYFEQGALPAARPEIQP